VTAIQQRDLFRGDTAAASLKLVKPGPKIEVTVDLPRRHSVASLKHVANPHTGILRLLIFRGITAAASLKHRQALRPSDRERHIFRGVTTAASFKRCHALQASRSRSIIRGSFEAGPARRLAAS
jgi:hypothetical protein